MCCAGEILPRMKNTKHINKPRNNSKKWNNENSLGKRPNEFSFDIGCVCERVLRAVWTHRTNRINRFCFTIIICLFICVNLRRGNAARKIAHVFLFHHSGCRFEKSEQSMILLWYFVDIRNARYVKNENRFDFDNAHNRFHAANMQEVFFCLGLFHCHWLYICRLRPLRAPTENCFRYIPSMFGNNWISS